MTKYFLCYSFNHVTCTPLFQVLVPAAFRLDGLPRTRNTSLSHPHTICFKPPPISRSRLSSALLPFISQFRSD
nr:hypothetical protein BgiMline_000611 [Biomphalaria glabrata]